MKTRTILLTLFIFAIFGTRPLAAQQPAGGVGRYIIQLRGGVEPGQAAQRFTAQHGLGVENIYRFALNGFSATVPPARLAALLADPSVLAIEPDRPIQLTAQTVPTGISRINAQNYSTESGSPIANVNVAIIDTGIDATHPDLNVVGVTNCARNGPNNRSCRDNDGTDGSGHGTHVAGTVAAKNNTFGVVGVAPGARLWAVRVLDNNGSGWLSWLAAGVDWVTEHADVISVANMSLGWQGNSLAMRTAIQNSVAAGVVYVVAAGNDGKDVYGPDGIFRTADDFEPASYPEVMTVSALADTDGKEGGLGANTTYGADDTLATFSNFSRSVVAGNPVTSSGAAIDLAAPGVNILSTYKGGAYDYMSGTSMAAPHVTGAVALHIAANGRAWNGGGVTSIRQILINTWSDPQSNWRPSDTNDPDLNKEFLLKVADAPAGGTPTPTTTTVSSTAPTSNFNQSVTFTATVSPAAATGTVEFFIDGSPAGSSSLSGGSATLTISTLSVGPHSVVAKYFGDANYAPSDSVEFIQTVNQAPTSGGTFSLQATGSPLAQRGQESEFTITVVSDGFDGLVNLSVLGVPPQSTATFTPNSVSVSDTADGTSTLKIPIGKNTPKKQYTMTITGSSGGVSATTTVSLTVQ